MPPVSPIAMPAARAISVLGCTPMPSTTTSAGNDSFAVCTTAHAAVGVGVERLDVRIGEQRRCRARESRRPRARPCRDRAYAIGCVAPLDHRDVEPAPLHRFGHLEADVAAADDDRASAWSRPTHRVVAQRDAVGDRLDAVDARGIDTGQVRPHGRRAGRDDELVERLAALAVGVEIAHRDRRGRGVDRRRLRGACARRCRSRGAPRAYRAMSSSASWIWSATKYGNPHAAVRRVVAPLERNDLELVAVRTPASLRGRRSCPRRRRR